jgi:hypothetical protein
MHEIPTLQLLKAMKLEELTLPRLAKIYGMPIGPKLRRLGHFMIIVLQFGKQTMSSTVTMRLLMVSSK